ncbi:MAG TPA: NAD(+)/NADH kinase [Thermoanaerobaculia bacterium]
MPTPRTTAPLSPCVLVVKTPVASRKRVADRLVRTGRRLAGQVEDAAREQERTLATLLEALDRLGVEPLTVSVEAVDAQARRAIAGARLVITVGGDGTLLSTSHWVTGASLLGVNSAPRSSVGYLTLARRATLGRVLKRIASGALLPQPVARIEAELDGQLLRPALNDILVAHEQPAATSRYRLHLGRRAEDHRSSGLWVATAAGSTAGIRSAGGQVMPLDERRLQFRARELYRVRNRNAALETGFVEPGRELVVESAMAAGWLYIDGARMPVRFPFGARATFRVAEQPLRLFADPARWASP